MKYPKSLNDITNFTAEDCGISRARVKSTIKIFERNLRRLMSNPDTASSIKIGIKNVFLFKARLDGARSRLKIGRPRQKDLNILQLLKDEYTEGRQTKDVNDDG